MKVKTFYLLSFSPKSGNFIIYSPSCRPTKCVCVLSTQWMSMGLSVVLVWTPPTDFHSDKNSWNNCPNILFCVLQKNKSYTGLEQHNNDLVNCSFKMHTWQRNRFLELSPSEKAIWVWFLTVCHMAHKYGAGISNTSLRSCHYPCYSKRETVRVCWTLRCAER